MNPEQDPNANCRLKNNLNPDCLANIFEYLDIRDLMTVSQMNSHFKQIIADYIIPQIKPCVGVSCLVDNMQFFSIFGNKLKKFRFAGRKNHLYDLLTHIVSYCPDTKFNDIEIDLDLQEMDFGEDADTFFHCQRLTFLITEAEKSFWNLEKLAIHGFCNENVRPRINYIYNGLFRNSVSIRCLKLQNTFVDEEMRFLNGIRFANLTELELIQARVEVKYLCNLLETGPRLRRFVNERSIKFNCIEQIGKKLVEFCKDTLHTFCDMDAYRYDRSLNDYLKRYSFITDLTNLKKVTLTSFFKCANDLYYPLLALSRVNKLEFLGIYHNTPRCDMETLSLSNRELRINLERFTNLRTIKICAINVDNRHNSPMHLEFLMKNACKILQNVSQFYLIGASKFIYPSNIVQLIPNLRLLSICRMEHFDADVVISNLKKTLNARGNSTNDFVELVFDKARYQELENTYGSDVFDKIRFKTVDDRGLISIANNFYGIFY